MNAPRVERRFVDLDGPVHYADFGGDPAHPIVLVHGLGGSHLNWLAVAPRLTAHGRVLALDLAGHGRTPSLGRTARVEANRRLVGRFIDAVAGGSAVLMGNSMGGYLSLLEAAEEPAKITALVLVNAAVPLARGGRFDVRVAASFFGMAVPLLGEAMVRRHVRRGPERMVREMLHLCCVDSTRIAPDVVAAHVELAKERAKIGRPLHADFLAAQRSLMKGLFRRRHFFRTIQKIRAPTLVLQGDRDRLVRLAATRALAAARPDWQLEIFEGVGHVPMLEVPDRFLAVVEPWLSQRLAA